MRLRHLTFDIVAVSLFVSTNAFAQTPAEPPHESPPANAPPANAPPANAPAPQSETPVAPSPVPKAPAVVIPAIAERPLVEPTMWGSALRPPTLTVPRWYGWQTLAVLVPVDVISVIGIAAESKAISLFALFGLPPIHLLTGSFVHLAHGRVGPAFASLGLTTTTSIMGYLSGLLAGPNESHTAAFLLGGIGLVGAHVIDIGFLSKETVKVPITPARGARALLPSSVSIVPMIETNRRGFSIVGQF